MQGAFDFEFIGNFFHEFLTLCKITVFRRLGKPSDFVIVSEFGGAGRDPPRLATRGATLKSEHYRLRSNSFPLPHKRLFFLSVLFDVKTHFAARRFG
jgi:hypothetical protein